MNTILTILLVTVTCYIRFGESTICEPFSTFKIDCNTCTCSKNGLQYACTDKRCPPPRRDDFIEETSQDGFVLLKPKHNNKINIDNYGIEGADDFTLTKNRKSRGGDISFGDDGISVNQDSPEEEAGSLNNNNDNENFDSEWNNNDNEIKYFY